MKPKSTKATFTKLDNDFYAKQTNAPPTIIELKSPDFFTMSDIEYFRRKMHSALRINHEPQKCLMCNMGKMKLDGPVCSMGYGSFDAHLRSLLKSKGQSPNRELISDMYKKYQEAVESVRLISNKANRPLPPGTFTVTIGVSA